MTALHIRRSFAFVLVMSVALIISLEYVTAQTAGPTVKVELSPSALGPGGSTILYVTVSNPRNMTKSVNVTYSQLNISPVIPTSWNISELTSEPVGALMSGQSLLAAYRITVPSNASQGNYSLHVRVSWNGTYSAIYSGPIQIQYAIGPSLPGDIPFALAVMILPGFIAFALGIYLGGSKLGDRSTLQLVLVSILLGAFIWQTGKLGFILGTPNIDTVLSTLSDRTFFLPVPLSWYFWNNLNLQNIWVRTTLAAIAIAIAARIGGVVSATWDKVSGAVGSKILGGVGRTWKRWVTGFEEMHITAWEAQMRSSRQNRRGYRTKVTLSIGQDPKNKTATGLFISGDPKDPLNVILDPQYVVENADRELLVASAPFWLRKKVKTARADSNSAKDDLSSLLRDNGSIIENALQRAMKEHRKVSYRFLNGRTLIREPVLEWEMSPEREPMAKFRIDGFEVPQPEMKPPVVIVPTSLLKARAAKAYSQQQLSKMKRKLGEEGQTTPIKIDRNFQIIDGNLRYLAAKELRHPSLTAVMTE